MRWLLNGILVVAGAPLVGMTLVVIGSFAPALRDDFNWPVRFGLFGLWLCFFALFAVAYMARTRWLERSGIYRSWSNFEAYMIENHGHPSVSEVQKMEFLSWAGLPSGGPVEFREAVKAVYGRIQAEMNSQRQRESYIKCLAWYAEGWPVHEACYDVCDDDVQGPGSGGA